MFNIFFLFIFFYLRLSGRFRRCVEYCGVPAIIKSHELRIMIRWLSAANDSYYLNHFGFAQLYLSFKQPLCPLHSI